MQTKNLSLPLLASNNAALQLIGAMCFGGLILFAVGFLSMDAAHNAAHDTRHAFAFPCH
ncbi:MULTISPECIES: CbtB domain-containing protein [Hahella]|nr:MULTISPECIES: CbtB domain-containing protein [Hahella]AZZ94898.1 CbtB-domain containing protein [Hahella sp. KA22]MBU6955469.1 CbtB-domain containing protein [Hahella sp. HN01]MDG9666999.1 CbtB-domain containing protein [Hahella sp. CR1]QAY52542.1 CbtB-domain containing protein [Hahella sp. KA22]QAY58271.1 CbtB-domain containing protein [Hahella sp. KA22]